MPAKLKRCVRKVKAQGKSEDSAYAICSTSTGWKKAGKHKWRKESTMVFDKLVENMIGQPNSFDTPTNTKRRVPTRFLGLTPISERMDEIKELLYGDIDVWENLRSDYQLMLVDWLYQELSKRLDKEPKDAI